MRSNDTDLNMNQFAILIKCPRNIKLGFFTQSLSIYCDLRNVIGVVRLCEVFTLYTPLLLFQPKHLTLKILHKKTNKIKKSRKLPPHGKDKHIDWHYNNK